MNTLIRMTDAQGEAKSINPGKTQKIIYSMVLFAVYSFVLTMTLEMNDKSSGSMSAFLHYASSFSLGLGFLLFYLSRKITPSVGYRKTTVMAISGLCTFFLVLRVSGVDNLALMLLCALSVGFLGGFIYYYVAVSGSINGRRGLIFAGGSTIAIIIQYFVQGFAGNPVIIAGILIMAQFLIVFFVIHPMGDYTFEEMLPYTDNSPKWNKYIRIKLIRHTAISLCVLYAGLVCEIDYIVNDGSGLNMYGMTRLMIPVGYFVIALAYDMKNFISCQIAMLCILLTSFIASPGADFPVVRLCLFYMLAGACVSFINMGFWEYAPKTAHPDFWAVFGRVITIFESVFVAVLSGVLGKGRFVNESVLICFIILAFVLFVRDSGQGNDTEVAIAIEKEAALDKGVSCEEKHSLSDKEIFDMFAEEFNLTPKERDVLEVLLKSDAKMKVLAEEVGVSERMMYRYMNQLYCKTDAESRAGLVKVYYDFTGKLW